MSSFKDLIASLRKDYTLKGLSRDDLASDPMVQFQSWFQDVLNHGIDEPNAMILATADLTGAPLTRVVLLKGIDERGFIFYTNYQSQKGNHLTENPQASLCFFWKEFERQVNIQGRVEQVSAEESDAYFATRPISSRLGAWASAQSTPIESSLELLKKFKDFELRFYLGDIPRPPHWGGYRVIAHAIEFWQGRPSRLHDRFRYRKGEGNQWLIEQLSP